MTEFETQVRTHLVEMVKRPLTPGERLVLAQALEQRRQAQKALDDALINALLS